MKSKRTHTKKNSTSPTFCLFMVPLALATAGRGGVSAGRGGRGMVRIFSCCTHRRFIKRPRELPARNRFLFGGMLFCSRPPNDRPTALVTTLPLFAQLR